VACDTLAPPAPAYRPTSGHWTPHVQLIAEHLTIERGGRAVVRDLSFHVASGEALVLAGPNGAGKTSLLRALAGFLPLAEGRVVLDGGDDELTVGEQSHAIGHANGIKGHLSVRENVAFWGNYLAGVVMDGGAIDAALDHFGVLPLAEFRASDLSAGQKRRVGLARLLVARRPVWLLDEPTVSLDTASAVRLADAVNAHVRGGGLAIAATHLALGLENSRELRLGSRVAAT
jgi:heme exporter protein A